VSTEIARCATPGSFAAAIAIWGQALPEQDDQAGADAET